MKKRLIDLPQRDIEKYAMKFYKMAHGKSCNIDHPVLFTEKIQWYTYRYQNPMMPYIVDKVTFKDYISQKLGSNEFTIPLLGHWHDIADLMQDWEQLPEEFCLKSPEKE